MTQKDFESLNLRDFQALIIHVPNLHFKSEKEKLLIEYKSELGFTECSKFSAFFYKKTEEELFVYASSPFVSKEYVQKFSIKISEISDIKKDISDVVSLELFKKIGMLGACSSN
jgi:hypothetical protein